MYQEYGIALLCVGCVQPDRLVSPAGPATLVTATAASSVRRWDLAGRTALQTDPAALACAAVGTGLDRDQWATFLPTETYTPTCPLN